MLATFVVAGLACGLWTDRVRSQQKPLPPAEAFYAEVKRNLARADREQFRYAYRERRSEVHANPFGKIGTGGTLVYEVVPGSELGLYKRKLVERDGKRLTDEKLEDIDRRSRVQDNNPSIDDVVAALDQNAQRGVSEAEASLNEYFAAHPNR